MKMKDLSKIFLWFVFVTLSIGFLIFVLTSEAQAANFTVNNSGDTSDVTSGDGFCVDTGNNCTLRAAIEEANAFAGNDTIDFAASLTNATITLTTGVEIAISGTNGTLQINGLGADKLTIDGGAGSNRIFLTINSAVVTITGVTLQGGNGNSPSQQGGAIYANGGSLMLLRFLSKTISSLIEAAEFIITAARIIAFSTPPSPAIRHRVGGGLYLDGGMLFVANTTVSGNGVTNSGSAAGGVYISGGSGDVSQFYNYKKHCGGERIWPGGVQASGTLNFGNTIIAGNECAKLSGYS